MKITTKDGLTLELPNTAEVRIEGDKITVVSLQSTVFIHQYEYPPHLALPSLYPHSPGAAIITCHVPNGGITFGPVSSGLTS